MFLPTKLTTVFLKRRTLLIYIKMNASKTSKTHYDTLKINSDATHGEIKTAYYKLTLEYHPDKNKSEAAKEIFQQISDAYEILSNYNLRKQYDRTILVKHLNVHKPKGSKIVRYQTTPSMNKLFDFDEWTKAHYGVAFQRQMKRNANMKNYMNQKEYYMKLENENKPGKHETATSIYTKSVVYTSIFLLLIIAKILLPN